MAVGDSTAPLVFTKVTANQRGQITTLNNYTDIKVHSDAEQIATPNGLRVYGVSIDSTLVWASDNRSSLTSRKVKIRVVPKP